MSASTYRRSATFFLRTRRSEWHTRGVLEPDIDALRAEIDRLDAEILAAVKRRTEVSQAIGKVRMASGGTRLVHSREMKVIEKRAADEGLCALGLRFSGDPMAPGERFTTLKDRLGDAFEVIEIDSAPGNAGGFGRMAHSVLTLEVRDVDGQPAYEARKRMVEFLKERLA